MTPDTLGPYTIGEALGKGGMGSVYRATHRESGEQVAVKVLSPRLALNDAFRERFEGEIDSLKALRHNGIVRLYGYGEEDGVPFFAMELVEGPSLEAELRAGRRFTWAETTRIAIEVCRALKHAHDHGVIHRDLKPANILLAPSGQAKLADFGIARVFGSTGVTIAGGVLGTADYMSPEQAAGKPVTARCDQYSLGGVMYALLAGRPPFRAADVASMLQLHRFATPEPVRRFAPDTPEDLERVVQQLLEKDATDRFPNTLVVARRLEAMTRGLARPDTDSFQLYEPPAAGDADREDRTDEVAAFAVTRDATKGPASESKSLPLEPPDGPTRAVEPTTDPDATPSYSATARPAASPPAPTRPRYTAVTPDAASGPTPLQSIAGQATVLALAVALVGLAVWWMLRPVTADTLYGRIATQIEAGDLGSATERDIQRFGERFADDPRATEVEAWGREIAVERMQKRLRRRRTAAVESAERSPAELLYAEASAKAEQDPAGAADLLEQVATLLAAGGKIEPSEQILAEVASEDARRLRVEAGERSGRIARYCLERLQATQEAGDDAVTRRVARAILTLLPEDEASAAARAAAAEVVGDSP